MLEGPITLKGYKQLFAGLLKAFTKSKSMQSILCNRPESQPSVPKKVLKSSTFGSKTVTVTTHSPLKFDYCFSQYNFVMEEFGRTVQSLRCLKLCNNHSLDI